ncbi:hypothetical protein D3C77_456620 [compost metagenome]
MQRGMPAPLEKLVPQVALDLACPLQPGNVRPHRCCNFRFKRRTNFEQTCDALCLQRVEVQVQSVLAISIGTQPRAIARVGQCRQLSDSVSTQVDYPQLIGLLIHQNRQPGRPLSELATVQLQMSQLQQMLKGRNLSQRITAQLQTLQVGKL